MHIIKKTFPVERYGYCTDASLDEFDIKVLEELGIEEVRYFYGTGSWEGDGKMLALKEGLWYLHDMSHCSCYGATDKIALSKGYSGYNELLANCTDEMRKDVELLIN